MRVPCNPVTRHFLNPLPLLTSNQSYQTMAENSNRDAFDRDHASQFLVHYYYSLPLVIGHPSVALRDSRWHCTHPEPVVGVGGEHLAQQVVHPPVEGHHLKMHRDCE